MALIKDQTKHLVPPHEPESWFDVRPLRTGDLEQLGALGYEVKVTVEALASVIVRWSYEDEVTLENVRLLDLETFLWLGKEALLSSGIKSEAEKKELSSGLSAQRPPAADSPTSSPTSESSGT